MSKVLKYTPELEGDEQLHVARLMKDMTEEQAEYFARVLKEHRKDPTVVLLADLLGFLGIAGIHRFLIGQIGMGLLYLFTMGLCGVGTIADIFLYKKITTRFNINKADEAAALIHQVLEPPADDDPRSSRG